MALKEGLRKDLSGEKKAIRDYSTRIEQAKGSGVTSDLKEIRGDEQDHKRRLTKALQGLKHAQ